MSLENIDDTLRVELRRLSRQRFWSHVHGTAVEVKPYFEYPARMVAPVQRDIIGLIKSQQAGVRTCFEPFAGSGTVLLECMAQGLSVLGQDVNPLAVLLCRARASKQDRAACDPRLTPEHERIIVP